MKAFVCLCGFAALLPCAARAWGANDTASPASQFKETEAVLPALPEAHNLIAFRVGAQPVDRYLVDSESLAPGEDGVTRFVLVLRGSGGASTATFEGVRCATGERKLYASAAGRDTQWRPLKNGEWRLLDGSIHTYVGFDYNGNDPRAVLASDYLCDGTAARAKKDILARLRGKHVDYLDPGHGLGQ
ncbi:MAG: CNP1-like family protein [Azoarcus sp.]|jgi:hypothetical protein|nr:CNP1-like family protein [Azoarcus sp.]